MDLNKFSDCLKIVDIIIEHGGWDTVGNYLASEMLRHDEVYEDILNSHIHGKKVKELI